MIGTRMTGDESASARAACSEAERLMRGWLRSESRLFHPTVPEHVTIADHSFRIGLLYKEGGTVVDLGGGLSLADGALAQLGMKVWVMDMMESYWDDVDQVDDARASARFLEAQGVQFITADLSETDLQDHFPAGSLDRITSTHTVEHLHKSPRRLLESAAKALAPGGRMLIEVPNAINLRKRISVLLGKTNYQPFAEFYDAKRWNGQWFGHIREYCVDDLRYMAQKLNLGQSQIVGRNWYGGLYTSIKNAALARLLDRMLMAVPGFCGSLFLVMDKPGALEQ